MRPDDDPHEPIADLNSLLAPLDHTTPRIDAADVMARARAHRSSWSRRAAVILVLLGAAGAGWALPGSPLPRWVRTLVGADAPEPTRLTAVPSVPTDQPIGGGVALDPDSPQIVVFAPAPDAMIEVHVVDEGPIALWHAGGGARFDAAPDRLNVEDIAAGTRFDVEVPRAARDVELRVGVRVVWRWPGAGPARIPLEP